jgi:hypothetical protein
MSLKDRHDCDRMVVGATTTYATSTYHNYVVSSNPTQVRFTRYSIMWYVCGFLRVLRYWPIRYSWNIVESGVKHHNPNAKPNTSRKVAFESKP